MTIIRLLSGDFRKVIQQCPADRFDAVITDLPYVRRCHPLFSDASRVARRVLKPGGSFLTYTGHQSLPDLLSRLEEHLTYRWIGYMIHSRAYYRPDAHVQTYGKPYVLFYKPPYTTTPEPFLDALVGSGKSKQWHPWEQPVEESRKFIRWLTKPGDWILDPCVGSGTTLLAARLEGRNAIGIELDPETFRRAQQRLGVR